MKVGKDTSFGKDFGASKTGDILAEFDFDTFLNDGDDKSTFNVDLNQVKVAPFKPNSGSSEAALSQQREIKTQVEELITNYPTMLMIQPER